MYFTVLLIFLTNLVNVSKILRSFGNIIIDCFSITQKEVSFYNKTHFNSVSSNIYQSAISFQAYLHITSIVPFSALCMYEH